MKNFQNKIVVITGAGSGMGKEYAFQFAKLGAKLALNDYNKTSLEQVKIELNNQGFKDVMIDDFDVSNKDKMNAFADKVKATFGNAHVLINNAGIEGATEKFMDITDEDFERLININFYGVVYGSRAFLPQLVANNEGALVNISSIFGLHGMPTQSDYCASKFAVRGFTESLMVEFYESPIQIHIVHPGGINTNIAQHELSAQFAENYLTTTPESIVKYVIKGIKRNQLKMVYGQDSLRVRLAANFLPKRFSTAIINYEMKKRLNY